MEFDSGGYMEVPHTADWALRVWAPSFPHLFSSALAGMQALMGVSMMPNPPLARTVTVQGMDQEALLVAGLSEVLYLLQSEGLGVCGCDAQMHGKSMTLHLAVCPVRAVVKEIKAVTYHDLNIIQNSRGFETTLVFDV